MFIPNSSSAPLCHRENISFFPFTRLLVWRPAFALADDFGPEGMLAIAAAADILEHGLAIRLDKAFEGTAIANLQFLGKVNQLWVKPKRATGAHARRADANKIRLVRFERRGNL